MFALTDYYLLFLPKKLWSIAIQSKLLHLTRHFQRFEITNVWVEKSNILEVKFEENFEP